MAKYRPTGADLNRLLQAADRPFGIGDLVFRLVPDGTVVDSVKDAEQHVSRAGVEFVLKELHTNAAVARHSGAEWSEMGISWYDQRPSGIYYALASKVEEWLRQRAERKERELAKKNDAQAHEQAIGQLVAAHQEEYDRYYEAARTGEKSQPESSWVPPVPPVLPPLQPSDRPLSADEITSIRECIHPNDRYMRVQNPQSTAWTSMWLTGHEMRQVLDSYIRDGHCLTGNLTDIYATPGRSTPYDEELRYIRVVRDVRYPDDTDSMIADINRRAVEEEGEETPGLDELMTITFHGLDQLVTADVRLTHQLYLGEHLASGTLRAKVIDVTQGLGDPGPPLVDVAVDRGKFPGMLAEHVVEELQRTPGVSDVHVDDGRCMGKCCPPPVAARPLKVLGEDTDPMTLNPGDLVRHPDHGIVEVQERFTALRTESGIVADGQVYHLPSDKMFVVRWQYDDLIEDRIDGNAMYVLQEQTGPASWNRADLMSGSTARAGITYDRLNRQAIITEVQPGEYRIKVRTPDDGTEFISRYIREDLLQSQESSS